MSTALVVNTTAASPAARVANARASVASSIHTVDAIDTESFAARGRDQAHPQDEREAFDSSHSRRRFSNREQFASFGGVMVSRDVGTAIVQAQAALGGQSHVANPHEAERQISIYEFNQSLMGAPEITTDVGVVH